MQHRILLTVVTRDRVNCLKTFLNLACAQTLQPSNILVVDNDSAPETETLVREFMANHGHILYLNTKENGGSAGGQSIALTYAAANNFDLVYTMDDDCEPLPDALKNVYEAWLKAQDPQNTVLSGVALSLENDQFSFALWKLKDHIFGKGNKAYWSLSEIPENEISNGVFYGWSHFFLGVLIPTSIIQRIGSVNPKYFIRGDELEYFIRLRESGIVLGAVVNSLVRHPQELPGNTNSIKLYYSVRNNIEIRMKYYPTLKYNRFVFKCWVFLTSMLPKSKSIQWLAVKDAISMKFDKKPNQIKI